MEFTFLHAADLHLDSPLIGLSRRSSEFAAIIEEATRRAFDNLIRLAIQEKCRFVVIAGDVFDGQWRDYRTGLFFADRMRRLREENIQVVMILGNHDAENRFASRLELSENVTILSHKKPQSVTIADLDVTIHGRSYPKRDVVENIALDYPAAVAGNFNIGLLHTACTGRAGHQSYAPCTLEQLVSRSYDYWALGHVHAREELSTNPYVVYPGNLQGRHIHETGPKGATLVRVADQKILSVAHEALDVVRWAKETLDVTSVESLDELYADIRRKLEFAHRAADGRGLAARIELSGCTTLHHEMILRSAEIKEEIATMAAAISDEVWLEEVEIHTAPPEIRVAADPTVSGKLIEFVHDKASDVAALQLLEGLLSDIKAKMPANAHADETIEALRNTGLSQAVRLATSLVASQRGE